MSQLYYAETGEWPANEDASDGIAELDAEGYINAEDFEGTDNATFSAVLDSDNDDVYTVELDFDGDITTWTPDGGFSSTTP